MQIIDNVNELLGEDLRAELRPESKVRIAASTFSIYAFEALRKELERIEELEFIFTSPSFVTAKATDRLPKERRQFFLPSGRNGGLELSLSIKSEEIDGREVFTVDVGTLIACFAPDVTPAVVQEIAKRAPLRAVFRDSSFGTDTDRRGPDQRRAGLRRGVAFHRRQGDLRAAGGSA